MKVYLGLPHYGPIHIQAARAFFATASKENRVWIRQAQGGSLLTKCFNILWSTALNAYEAGHVTHFAMMHADVAPEDGWVDRLGELIDHYRADVVSVVLPIKNRDGVTSTAVDGDDPFQVRRRLTMHELQDLPLTFSSEDVEGPLLVNTGCFIADLRRDWCREHCFTVNDTIREIDGVYHVGVESEDWNFSRYLNRIGAKVMATSEVTAAHFGETDYLNQGAWGHEHDPNAASVCGSDDPRG